MKSNYLILGILAIILIVIGLVIYTPQESDMEGEILPSTMEEGVLFTMEEYSGNKTILSKIPLDEASAKILAEKSIDASEEADYKFECLIFDSVEKRVDSRDGEEIWDVGFRCNDECNEVYINCGAVVMILENTREVILGFPN